MDTAATAADPLAAGVHRVRMLSAEEAPMPATRATIDGIGAVLLVDVAVLDGWEGWRAAGAQHVLAPVDVLRRHDGHDAILPDVAGRLSAACGRRESDGAAWSRGEAVTIAVSLLRGVAELEEHRIGADARGAWWLTADGRPVFVATEQGDPAHEEARRLISRAIASCDDRVLGRAGEQIQAALATPRALTRSLDDLEASLFDCAAPQPLALRGRTRSLIEPRHLPEGDEGEGGLLRNLLERHVDGRIAEVVAGTVERIRRLRAGDRNREDAEPEPTSAPRRTGRRPALLLGGAAALLVLVGGMLWPNGEESARKAVAADPAPVSASPAADTDPTGSEPADAPEEPVEGQALSEDPGGTPESPVDAARALLAVWDACPDSCAHLFSGGASPERTGALARSSEDRDVGLVDDYGGVALLAVTAPDEARTYLVVEQAGEGWRIRDAYE